jgi:two-component system, cell cycle sensor histidine kinase and response regulator CckA
MREAGGNAVLLVEDEAELRSLFAVLLEMESITVFQAEDGEQALQVFEEHRDEIGLLITDLGLPHVGGVDLIGRMRAMKPSMRILGTSGLSADEVREMVITAGADDFIPKPFSPQEAIEKVRTYLPRP